MSQTVLVLVPALAGRPRAPETLPTGRAALRLEAEGVGVSLRGLRAVPGGWLPDEREVVAVYNRSPSSSQVPDQEAPAGLPLWNSLALREICRDKLVCGRLVGGPEIVDHDLEAHLEAWGSAFLKPRFSASGTGVRRVERGEVLPRQVIGSRGLPEPVVLQRAVEGPPGRYLSLRALVQRVDEGWRCAPLVARVGSEPVVNVHRGARALPARELLTTPELERARGLAVETARLLGGVELGVDLVLDRRGQPHVIEVNSLPYGRLEALGAPLAEEHVAACARPIRWLYHRYARAGAPRPRGG